MTQAPLMPIPEMPQLDSDKGERMRAKFLHRSYTAERVLRDWAGLHKERDDCWLGTPPRDNTAKEAKGDLWIRKLQRTRSHGDITNILVCCRIKRVIRSFSCVKRWSHRARWIISNVK